MSTLELSDGELRLVIAAIALVVSAVIGVVGIVSARRLAKVARETERLRQTQALHQYLNEPKFYADVSVPAWMVWLKWKSSDDAKRLEFHQIIMKTWINYSNNEALNHFSLNGIERESLAYQHFFPNNRTGISEQQALTLQLHFWTRLSNSLRADSVDKEAVKILFSGSYLYIAELFHEMRLYFIEHSGEDDIEPGWVSAVAHLEQFFGYQNIFRS